MKNYQNEPTNKYLCRICNTEHGVKGFSYHLKMHNVAFKDYVKENLADFAPTWKMCPVCNENITNRKTCSKHCGYILRTQTQPVRNIWEEMDEETKAKAKKAISEKATINGRGRNIWEEMSEETRKQAKQKIATKTAARVKGEGNPMFGKMWTEDMIKKIIKSRRSNKLEGAIKKFLDDNNIKYIHQFYQKAPNRRCFYDFHIVGTDILIEMDGDYWHGGPGETTYHHTLETNKESDLIKNKLAESNGFRLLRFWESEVKTDFDLVKSKILQEIERRK